ncbi:MAG: LuxR C-terminal-related transcriptional regulator [Paracoccaceae bacterium]
MKEEPFLPGLLRTVSQDPSRDDAIAALWRASYQEADGVELDGELETAIDSLRTVGERFESNIDLRRLLGQFHNPALLIRKDATVYDMNARARQDLSISVDEPVSKLSIALEKGESLEEAIKNPSPAGSNSGVRLLRGYAGEQENELTVALIDVGGQRGLTVMFVIDPRLSVEVAREIGRYNDLTEAEITVLCEFLKGSSLAEISEARGRSLATVRTQFNSILSKFGVKSQAALVRVVLGLSSFLGEIEELRPVFEHPYRRKFLIPVAGGRAVEFYVAGHPEGRVVIHPSDVLSYTFSAEIEKMFFDAGLKMISVARPGIAATDPTPAGMTKEQCHTEDVAAVLRTLNIGEFVLFGSGLSSPMSVYLGAHFPASLRRVVLNSPIMPRRFFRKDQGDAIPALQALMRAAWISPKMLRLILKATEAHVRLVGARRFISAQFSAIPMDKETALRPENLRELQFAMDSQYTLGNKRDESDFMFMGIDWSAWIDDCKAPIAIVHGVRNPVMIPAIYARFRDAYPDKVALWPIPEGAGAPGITHAQDMVNFLCEAFETAT